MDLKQKAGRIARRTGYAKFLAPSAKRDAIPLVGYIGWTGEGNLGDEAMYQAHLAGLGFAMRLVPLPILDSNSVLRLIAPRLSGICLGGGTLIGNGYFRGGLESAMSAAPGAYRFMIGPGVESAEYTLGNRQGVAQEVQRWTNLLSEFETVRVRGPLSCETLADVGTTSRVAGDPALALPSLSTGSAAKRGLVGINVGLADDQWGAETVNPATLLSRLTDEVRKLGLRPRLIPTTNEDLNFMLSVRPSLGEEIDVPERLPPLASTMQSMGECSALIGMKLHALVLAVGQEVPVFGLEYRPKCRDFMESVASGEYNVRLDQVEWDQLRAWLTHVTKTGALPPVTKALGELRLTLDQAFTEEAGQVTARAR